MTFIETDNPSPEENQKLKEVFEIKLEIERGLFEYLKEGGDFDPSDWISKYGKVFNTLFDSDDLIDDYKAVYDKNPNEFYLNLQKRLESMV